MRCYVDFISIFFLSFIYTPFPGHISTVERINVTNVLFLWVCLKREDEVSRFDRLPFHRDPVTHLKILQIC